MSIGSKGNGPAHRERALCRGLEGEGELECIKEVVEGGAAGREDILELCQELVPDMGFEPTTFKVM